MVTLRALVHVEESPGVGASGHTRLVMAAVRGSDSVRQDTGTWEVWHVLCDLFAASIELL